MNEANRKRLHETIIRLVNGEKIVVDDKELFFSEGRAKIEDWPFRYRKENGSTYAATVATLIKAAGPIPWYEQTVFPVMCYVSNVVDTPDDGCPTRLITEYSDADVVDLNKLETGKEKMFVDECGDPWKYVTPVPSRTMDSWKLFSEYEIE